MTTFDQREEAFERRFAHDEELRFRAKARRDKLLGLWAAEKIGLSPAETDDYVAALIAADVAAHGDEAVFERLQADLAASAVVISDHRLRRTMEEFLHEAIMQVRKHG